MFGMLSVMDVKKWGTLPKFTSRGQSTPRGPEYFGCKFVSAFIASLVEAPSCLQPAVVDNEMQGHQPVFWILGHRKVTLSLEV